METTSFENEFVRYWIEDGIMYGSYKPNVIIDLDLAKKVAAERIKLANGVSYPFMGFIDELKRVTKEARDYFSHDDGIRYMKRLALFTNSPISRMIGNFFLQISKPTIPTRLFTNRDEAVSWLKED